MNNFRNKQEKKLFIFYKDYISSDNVKKLIEFLRKYIQHYEDDNSLFKRTVTNSNPLEDQKENMEDIIQIYNTIIYEIKKYISTTHAHYHNKKYTARLIALMGVIYEKGFFGIKANKEMALKKYKQSAQLNCPFGTFRLAQCYEKGIGTDKNLHQALYFYRCSAKLGSIEALHTFGTILLQNDFDEEYTDKVGIVYLRLAAKKATNDYPYACYDYSRYVEHNLTLNSGFFDISYCFESYLKGALLECPNCQYKVGLAYEAGDLGVERSLINAIKWFQKSASNGHSDAQLKMADFLLKKNEFLSEDFELASSYALQSAISENPRGAKYVSILYQRGIGVKRNRSLSEWWNKVYEVYCKTQKISTASHSFTIFDNVVLSKHTTEDIPMRAIYPSNILKAS